ncbi:hypothetical protein [Actinomadura madurae]|uniref:hypothetical protein n=1 Tax=Actinomadura madurae TaxID=1993 RepID=UPI0020D20855|nr:hypothetical protein [Actinomadura madurae]MCP9965823.1 hypothetical protein [Actinomadura madurae]MCQ0014508.1 hypothetical protein [Actinomadura madurae]
MISTIMSGRVHDSSIGTPSRTRRYSGRERPAWRMNHTGVCGTGRRRQASRKGLSARPPLPGGFAESSFGRVASAVTG